MQYADEERPYVAIIAGAAVAGGVVIVVGKYNSVQYLVDLVEKPELMRQCTLRLIILLVTVCMSEAQIAIPTEQLVW